MSLALNRINDLMNDLFNVTTNKLMALSSLFILRDRTGWYSKKIPKFLKNQNLQKWILNLSNIKLVCFRLHVR